MKGSNRTMTSQTSGRPVAAEDLAAIERAAMDYELGWYEGDAARIGRALSPDLVKRAFLRDRATGEERLYELSRAQMVEKTEQGGGTATPPAQRYYEIAVLDVFGDIACARAESAKYVDYLQLARRDGQWVIVNVLWAYNRAPV